MMALHENAMGRLDSSLVNGLVQGDLTRSGYDLQTLHPQEAREVMAQLKVAPAPREFALKDRPYRPSIKKNVGLVRIEFTYALLNMLLSSTLSSSKKKHYIN